MNAGQPPLTYSAAGVDIQAGERAVQLMRQQVARARRGEVLDDIGGFAGLFDASALKNYDRPVLVSATDGVGTKLEIARRLDKHDTVGIDLVAMVADDIVVTGAEPLYLTDYIACGKVVPERIAQIVGGVATGCVRAGCALVGGETAEHPGTLDADQYDLAGAGTGVVEAANVLGPDRVRAGDAVIGMRSSGLHSNGYSLVRKVLAGAGWALDRHLDEFGRSVGEELLEPCTIYARTCLELTRRAEVRALAHITGGGIAGNLSRVLPGTVDAVLDRTTWTPHPVFTVLTRLADLQRAEAERTFNMGIGMVAVVARDSVADALTALHDDGVPAWVAGEVMAGTGEARLVGDYLR